MLAKLASLVSGRSRRISVKIASLVSGVAYLVSTISMALAIEILCVSSSLLVKVKSAFMLSKIYSNKEIRYHNRIAGERWRHYLPPNRHPKPSIRLLGVLKSTRL